jgi:hypothetical protein
MPFFAAQWRLSSPAGWLQVNTNALADPLQFLLLRIIGGSLFCRKSSLNRVFIIRITFILVSRQKTAIFVKTSVITYIECFY